MLEDGKRFLPSDLQSYSGQFKLKMPKVFIDPYLYTLKALVNQYCLYLLAKNDAEYKKKDVNCLS